MRKRLTELCLAGAAIALLATGCGETGQAEPTAAVGALTTSTSTGANVAMWDPCTAPASALSAAGLNPAVEDRDVAGIAFPDWRVCTWVDNSGTAYRLSLASTPITLEQARSRTDYTDYVDLSVGGLPSLRMQPLAKSSSRQTTCIIATQTANGVVEFILGLTQASKATLNACTEVQRLADSLIRSVPGA
ncbi:DUF3558 domain-containing protein [Nocardia camponoti]|uniref:DUF3558 domain-containing protein n=1 Tax=Nocardia camponoti TaxID=1616106 RepID=A0A917V5A3_9NOCA|nr:DUF3558 domain-containing protein [Nocardia camponoti]GGK38610.1 hypothetical protein GCM10011591_07950 [Nocardia camponoti]